MPGRRLKPVFGKNGRWACEASGRRVYFATDEKQRNVAAYAVFHGTHSGEGGPVPPTNKKVATDYVYVMQFEGDKIVHGEPLGKSADSAATKANCWLTE